MVFITIYMAITNYMAVVMDLDKDMDQEIVIFMGDMADMVDMADMTYMEDMADMEYMAVIGDKIFILKNCYKNILYS